MKFPFKKSIALVIVITIVVVTVTVTLLVTGYSNAAEGQNNVKTEETAEKVQSDSDAKTDEKQVDSAKDDTYEFQEITANNGDTSEFQELTSNLELAGKTVQYKVVLKGNGSTSGKTVRLTYEYGEKYALPANEFEKTGYVFTGWNTKKDGSGTPFEDEEKVENLCLKDGGKVVLYAQWKAKGKLIAEMAKKLAWPKSKKEESYYEPTSKFVKAANEVGVDVSDDCLDFVKTCVLASGVDDNFPIYAAETYLDEYMTESKKWERIYTEDESELEAGDILVSPDYDGVYNHILIYIGGGKIASANLYTWYGRIENLDAAWWGSGKPFKNHGITYHVYRIVK